MPWGTADQFDALPPNVAAAFRADPSYYLAQVPNPFQGSASQQSRFVGPDNSALEAVRALSPIQQRNGVGNQQQLRSVGQLHLQRGTAPHRKALLGRSAVPVLLHIPEEHRRFFARIQRLFVSDGRFHHQRIRARDPNNLRLDRSLSVFSIPQIAQLSFVYQLPFGRHRKYGANVSAWADALLGGWQVNGIYRIDDGLPVQLFLCGGCSTSLPTYGNQYPESAGPLQVAGTGNLNQYFANPQVAVSPRPTAMATRRECCRMRAYREPTI
jgi:hypothetical protein